MKETLQNHILESICKMSVREAEMWKTVSAFCVHDIQQQDIPASQTSLTKSGGAVL